MLSCFEATPELWRGHERGDGAASGGGAGILSFLRPILQQDHLKWRRPRRKDIWIKTDVLPFHLMFTLQYSNLQIKTDSKRTRNQNNLSRTPHEPLTLPRRRQVEELKRRADESLLDAPHAERVPTGHAERATRGKR